MVCSTTRFVLCLTLCYFILVFFSPFSIAITSLGEERANLIAFRTFFRFVLVWICRFSFPLGVWEGLRFVSVALPGLFSYLIFQYDKATGAAGIFAKYIDVFLKIKQESSGYPDWCKTDKDKEKFKSQ